MGYGGYFVITVCSMLPAMVLFICLWRRFDPVAVPSS